MADLAAIETLHVHDGGHRRLAVMNELPAIFGVAKHRIGFEVFAFRCHEPGLELKIDVPDRHREIIIDLAHSNTVSRIEHRIEIGL